METLPALLFFTRGIHEAPFHVFIDAVLGWSITGKRVNFWTFRRIWPELIPWIVIYLFTTARFSDDLFIAHWCLIYYKW